MADDNEKKLRRQEIQKRANDKRKDARKTHYEENKDAINKKYHDSTKDKPPSEYPTLELMFKHKTTEQLQNFIFFCRDKTHNDTMYNEEPNKGAKIFLCVSKDRPDQIHKLLSTDSNVYEILRDDVLLHPYFDIEMESKNITDGDAMIRIHLFIDFIIETLNNMDVDYSVKKRILLY